jgi:hypothetical protein
MTHQGLHAPAGEVERDVLDSMIDRPPGAAWKVRELAEDTGRGYDATRDALARLQVRGWVWQRTAPRALAGFVLTAAGVDAALGEIPA